MIIIDFEASSLRKNSYPIEVAWGSTAGDIKSYLLNPAYIDSWTDWNPKSYEYHGITMQDLKNSGEDPHKVASLMVSELAGIPVYSDEPHYDIRWKNRLLADTGHDPALVRIMDLNHYLNRLIQASSCGKSLNDFVCTFECSRNGRHRAAEDVFWLIEFAAYVKKHANDTGAGKTGNYK